MAGQSVELRKRALLLEEKNANQLEMSSLPVGMYFLRFGDNLKQTIKVIKE